MYKNCQINFALGFNNIYPPSLYRLRPKKEAISYPLTLSHVERRQK